MVLLLLLCIITVNNTTHRKHYTVYIMNIQLFKRKSEPTTQSCVLLATGGLQLYVSYLCVYSWKARFQLDL